MLRPEAPSENAYCTPFREQGMSAKPLDQRQFDLRLPAQHS
jgi:hypothetical protein